MNPIESWKYKILFQFYYNQGFGQKSLLQTAAQYFLVSYCKLAITILGDSLTTV